MSEQNEYKAIIASIFLPAHTGFITLALTLLSNKRNGSIQVSIARSSRLYVRDDADDRGTGPDRSKQALGKYM